MWSKALRNFSKILRQPELKYPPAIFTIYSGFSNLLLSPLDNNEDKNKLYKFLGGISMLVTS